jgi:hypothetical protein
MRNNQMTSLLVGMLFLLTLFTGWLTLKYNWSLRDLQQVQAKANSVNTLRNTLQSLAAETIEYSKKNPAIEPLLQSLASRNAAASSAAAAAHPGNK